MGCEFSQKVNAFQRGLIGELFNKLNNSDKSRFINLYGRPESVCGDYYEIYYHCKRVLKHYAPKKLRGAKFNKPLKS